MSQGLRGFASCVPLDQSWLPSVPQLPPPETGADWHFFLLLCVLLNYIWREGGGGNNIHPCLEMSKEETGDEERSSEGMKRY